MFRWPVLLYVLLCCTGCASSEQTKAQWAEFFKDLRGDNMQMRGFSDTQGSSRSKTMD